MEAPYVVMDVGSAHTKLGFAGNLQPTFNIPTLLASRQHDSSKPLKAGQQQEARGLLDLDFFIGEEAQHYTLGPQYSLSYPVRQSIVEDWDVMERFYQQCLFNYLRVEPEDHCLLLSEAPTTSPESRQQLAEIMFETFNVAGLYLGAQAVLSLYTATGVSQGTAALSSAASVSGINPDTLAGRQDQNSQGQQVHELSRGLQQHVTVNGPTGPQQATTGHVQHSHDMAQRDQQHLQPQSQQAAGSQQGGKQIAQAGCGGKDSVSWRAALSWAHQQGLDPYSLTGVVVDVGEGSTSVLPVVDGFVVTSCGRTMGVGGRDLTAHVQQALRSGQAGVPPDMSWEVARKIKERDCYVCRYPANEAPRLAARQAAGNCNKVYVCMDPRAGNKEVVVPLGPELFMAPELLLSTPPPAAAAPPPGHLSTLAPGLTNTSRSLGGWQPVPQLIDQVVQSCPIDARRPLYGHVALSGGTTCIKHFDKRVQMDLKHLANARLPPQARRMGVEVHGGAWAQYSAWLGGSLLAGGAAPRSLLAAATTSRHHWQETGCLLGAGLDDYT